MGIKQVFIENKLKIIFSAALICSFVLGFSFASVYVSSQDQSSSLLNNSSIQTYNQHKRAEIDEDCPVKAKKAKNGQYYHLPGSILYKRIKPTDCFKNEADAKSAGFTKYGR